MCVKTEYKWEIIPICKYENNFHNINRVREKEKESLEIVFINFLLHFLFFNSMNLYITYKKSLYLFL